MKIAISRRQLLVLILLTIYLLYILQISAFFILSLVETQTPGALSSFLFFTLIFLALLLPAYVIAYPLFNKLFFNSMNASVKLRLKIITLSLIYAGAVIVLLLNIMADMHIQTITLNEGVGEYGAKYINFRLYALLVILYVLSVTDLSYRAFRMIRKKIK